MARIEKRLLVKTRATIDGVSGLSDSNAEPIYTTSIMPLSAEPALNSINGKRPNGLKHEITRVDYDTVKRKVVTAGASVEDDDEETKTKAPKKTAPKKTASKAKTPKKEDPFEDESGDVTM